MSDPRDHDQPDSEDEEDFNPPPADFSDDENQDDSRRDQLKQQRKSSPTHNGDDEEDDDGEGDLGGGNDDDEEEDDEDEEDEVQTHRRKRRKGKANVFLDVEAEVDDEDEGEDDEEAAEENEGFIEHEEPGDFGEQSRLDDDRRHRELDRQRDAITQEDLERAAEGYVRKYGNRRAARGLGESAIVPQRLLLPSVDDPGIWGIRCKEGKEREVIMAIMKRVIERHNTKDQLAITAAFERGGNNAILKGLIYVEAPRQSDVMMALEDMMNVYPRTKLVLVDIKERPDLMRVQKTPTLEPGAWVRLRRPAKHSGDLAQVLDITENGLDARVRFIPRLDYGLRDEPILAADKKRKRPVMGPRPPQRLFSEVEARKRQSRILQYSSQTNTWNYNGDEFEKGFQVKDIKIQHLTVSDVNPTLEEVTKFASGGEDGVENIDLKSLAASLKDSNANVTYLPGDVVEVYEGEQKGVVGKATNVQADIVTIQVTEGDLVGQTIEVPTKGLRKQFRTGDHVKVIGGSRYRDEVGMVVNISEDRVTLLTDQTTTEITVFSKDLREASDIGGQGSLGQYSLLDLVQLDTMTVGCIVKVDRETLVVLDQNGDTRQVMPSQIANKLPKRKTAVAADRNGSEIRPDDVVKEYGGMGRQGKIVHIYRTYVFCHTNTTTENAGIFVSKVSNVSTISAKGGRVNAATSGPDLNVMNPARKLNPNGDRGDMPPPKATFGRDKLVGQTVTIRKGGWKGTLGRVRDTTDTHARVEIHSKGKVISVLKSDLTVRDSVTGREIKNYDSRRPGQNGFSGKPSQGNADWNGGRTPVGTASSRTPAWKTPSAGGNGGRTPAWSKGGDGGRTPAWADGSRTVNPYDGSRTSYGSGNRTPAWSSGAKTPAPDHFSHGSKTPAYSGGGGDNWGSKTPYGVSAATPGASGNDAWGYTPGASGSSNAYDAPTPGAGLLGAPTPAAMNAPTPGAYNAPTPGAMNAPTPGAGWQSGWGADSAPTPAAAAPTPAASGFASSSGYYGAPTPGAYNAETPAAGPRYTDDD
ncbi:transcription initiation protein [Annulohypoxylon maeteangense]|uniref:transcription initiation protein n=1 Tax=Annulohypoxylon maeteangense TaxID=1927788 RepID=UPI00200827F6|nr:transcription initiation protein [Annulohypoxylon maeteangense]KAI0882365.1 transcription initiation protein [Annulohypoxylon maeteangense]